MISWRCPSSRILRSFSSECVMANEIKGEMTLPSARPASPPGRR
ncbi:Uncharacterised protein [Mycobacteroides abscessus subsp. abscessus]|nr:Uncharacterised protein [Mycobacteroides abscessus subsp. abscessus]